MLYEYGEIAYIAYAREQGVRGIEVDPWYELDEDDQASWEEAARAVMDLEQ